MNLAACGTSDVALSFRVGSNSRLSISHVSSTTKMILLEMDDTVRNGNNDNVMVRIPAKVVSYQGRLAESKARWAKCVEPFLCVLTSQHSQHSSAIVLYRQFFDQTLTHCSAIMNW